MSTIAAVLEGRAAWCVAQGHVLDLLREIPDNSIHCVITSPPYWGLRAYKTEPQVWAVGGCTEHAWISQERPGMSGGRGGTSTLNAAYTDMHTFDGKSQPAFTKIGWDTCENSGCWRGELGSEPTPDLFVAHLVEVFREVRRVLHPSGTCWVNLGDSYAGSGKGGNFGFEGTNNHWSHEVPRLNGRIADMGLKPKDLCLIPFRFALAMQQDGWWMRSDVAWCKTSAMPESVQDRPPSAWEHVFLCTKSARYYFDQEAVRTPNSPSTVAMFGNEAARTWNETGLDTIALSQPTGHTATVGVNPSGANLRNFWLLGPEPYAGAHFATYPTELVRRCLLAGSSERGVCPSCGAPWRRVVEPTPAYREQLERGRADPSWKGERRAQATLIGNAFRDKPESAIAHYITTGWQPSCRCPAAGPIPAIILDPFVGSGTTVLTALRHNRRAIGLELNPAYVALSKQRIVGDAPLWNTPIEAPP